MYRQVFIAGSLLGALAATAGAQTPSSTTSNPLEEITVYATRIDRTLANVPAAVSVVGEDSIQTGRQQLTLDESLSQVPGVFMQDQYNFAQDLRISIRGFGARANFGIRGIKILVDGIPETLPDGQGSVDSIDIGATSEIEVIRGPSSTLYGNAAGGVVSVTTQDPPQQPTADVRLSGGDFGFHKLQFKLGAQGDRVGYLLSASDSVYDGYRQHSRAENNQLSGRFNFDLGQDRRLLTVVNYTDQPVSDDPGAITAAQAALDPRSARDVNVLYDGGEALTQSRVGFVYTMPLSGGQQITARNYYVSRDFSSKLPFQAGGVVTFDRFFAGGGFSYSNDGVWLDRPNRLIVGIDYDDQDDNRKRFDNDLGVRGALAFDQREHVTSQGVFLQDELSLTEGIALTLGLRHDQVRFDVTDHFLSDGDDSGTRTLDDVSPMVGLTVKLNDHLDLYSTYSSAFETPTTTEFNNPSGGGGFNPNLDPQTARNLEVGVRGSLQDRGRYELSLFNIKVKDELVPFEVPTNPGRDYFVNAGSSTRNGLEASWISSLTDNLHTTLSYTYSDFTFDRFVDASGNFGGNTIPGTAANVFFGELEYKNSKGWFGALDVTYIGKQFADNANVATNDPYTLADLRFGSRHELSTMVISPFLGINNVFDQRYNANVRINAFGGRFYEPGPDRNIYAGVNFNFELK